MHVDSHLPDEALRGAGNISVPLVAKACHVEAIANPVLRAYFHRVGMTKTFAAIITCKIHHNYVYVAIQLTSRTASSFIVTKEPVRTLAFASIG